MIRIVMSNGEEYGFKRESVEGFIKEYISNGKELPNKMVKLKEDTYINLSQIAVIEDAKYIEDANTIIP